MAIALALALAALLFPADITFNAKQVHRVDVTASDGEIKIRGTQPAQAKLNFTGDCEVDSVIDQGTLVIKVAAGCKTDLDIHVPMHVDTQITSKKGTVYVSGVRGALTLKLGQVNAVVGGQLSALKVQGEQTALSATGIIGDSDVQIANGNIQLWYDKQAHHALVLLHIGEGNVTVSAPGGKVSSQVRLDAGELHHDVNVVDGAPFRLDGVINRGSLFIRAAQ